MTATLVGCRCPQVFHGTRVWLDPEWQDDLAQLGLAEVSNWRTPVDVPPVSASKMAVACYRVPLPGGRVMYYKRYDYRSSWKARLRFWMRPSRAGVEQFGYGRYRTLGIKTHRVVGSGEARLLGSLSVAFIATEEVPSAMNFEEFVRRGMPGISEVGRNARLAAFARRLLTDIRKAHDACLFHYDLKWRNILIQQRDGEYYPVIIDCPRAFVSRLRRRYGITADLSALAREAVVYLTTQQRYRLLAAYLGDSAGPTERKYWYRRVQRRYERRVSETVQPRDSLLRGVRFDL